MSRLRLPQRPLSFAAPLPTPRGTWLDPALWWWMQSCGYCRSQATRETIGERVGLCSARCNAQKGGEKWEKGKGKGEGKTAVNGEFLEDGEDAAEVSKITLIACYSCANGQSRY